MGLGTARKTALVTGAAGFLGSHLVDRLLSEGFEVVGIDNLMTGDLANLASAGKSPHFHFQLGDVRDPIHVYADLIFNMACPASPVHYQADPYATLTTSVFGVHRLLEMVRGRNCRIVHASTSEVYGDPLIHPQTEAYWGNVNPIGERACYDEGKRCAEALIAVAVSSWKVDARLVRIFNTYGPRMAFNDGRVVSNFVIQALEGKDLTIFGKGDQTRSFCFYSDLIEGIVKVGLNDTVSTPLNIGNPKEFTILELAQEVRSLVSTAGKIVFRDLPADDPKQRKPDISKAQREIGFEARVQLKEGLQATIADFRERRGAAAS